MTSRYDRKRTFEEHLAPWLIAAPAAVLFALGAIVSVSTTDITVGVLAVVFMVVAFLPVIGVALLDRHPLK